MLGRRHQFLPETQLKNYFIYLKVAFFIFIFLGLKAVLKKHVPQSYMEDCFSAFIKTAFLRKLFYGKRL